MNADADYIEKERERERDIYPSINRWKILAVVTLLLEFYWSSTIGIAHRWTGDPSICWAVQLLMVFPRGLSFSAFILFIYQVIWNVCVLAHFLLAAIGKAQHYGGCYFQKRLSHSDYGIILGLKIVVLPSMTTIPYTAVRVVYRKESVARFCCSSHLKSLYMRWCRPPHYSLFNSTRKKERKKKRRQILSLFSKYFLILFLRRKRGISTGWRTRLFVVAVGFYRWNAAKFYLFHFFAVLHVIAI